MNLGGEDKFAFKEERRNLLRAIGASGLTLSGFASVAVADRDRHVQTEELDGGEVRSALRTARQAEPVKEMNEFLMEHANVGIDTGDFSGIRVTPQHAPEHVVLQATFKKARSDDVRLSLRVFDNTATASAAIGDTGYKANPETVNLDVSTATIDQDIVTARKWAQRAVDQHDVGSLSENCDTQKTFDAGGPACDFISGLALLSGTVMAFLPEPGTTIAGTTLVSGVIGGGCQITDAIDDAISDVCNYTKITVCVNYNCRLDPTVGTWCEPAIKVWPEC